MTVVNQGTISSEVSGRTITVTPASLTNSGTLSATSGGILVANSLTGNAGTGTVSGTGSQLTLSGTNYVNNLGLTAAAGTTLTLNGSWSSTAALNVNGGTLNLGGTFTTAGINLPAFTRTGGTVNVTGTLDNTGTTLPLNATTGSWNLAGGTVSGGTVTFAAGQTLGMTADSSNRLLNVTVSGDLTLSNFGARLNIEGTTTLA